MPTADRRPPSGSRPSRSQRRQQRLAAAAAEQLALRDQLLGHLVMQHQAAYKRTALDLARPAADFVGFRAGRQVVSVSSRPPTPDDLLERFTLACLTLGALDLDWAALLAGDEFAVAVTDPADHPADGSLFVVAVTVGPADASPAGVLIPYQLDRDTGILTWGAQRPLHASRTDGLWHGSSLPCASADRARPGQPRSPSSLTSTSRSTTRSSCCSARWSPTRSGQGPGPALLLELPTRTPT